VRLVRGRRCASRHCCEDVARPRHCCDFVDDLEVDSGSVDLLARRGVLRASRCRSRAAAPCVGEVALGERAVGDDCDALVEALRDHLALFLAVEKVVAVLHRDELRPAVAFSRVLGLRELPGVHRAGAEVTGLAGTDDVVEGFHRLFDRRLGVPAVHLVEIDVVHAESRERCASIAARMCLRERPRPFGPGVVG
jgi:hypothetical protein